MKNLGVPAVPAVGDDAESVGIAGCTLAGINILRAIRKNNKYIDDLGIVNETVFTVRPNWEHYGTVFTSWTITT